MPVSNLLVESPKITARAGTLKNKLQVRQLMEAIPKDDHDDIFSSTPMHKMHFQVSLYLQYLCLSLMPPNFFLFFFIIIIWLLISYPVQVTIFLSQSDLIV